MTLNITFSKDMPQEQGSLILNTLAKCKATGYTINRSNGKLRQLYNSSIVRDKVDSIKSFLAKHITAEYRIMVDNVDITPVKKAKTTRVKKVS